MTTDIIPSSPLDLASEPKPLARETRAHASAELAVSDWAVSARKRALDLALAVLLAAPALLITLAGAVVSAGAFRAWPFFIQRREGLRGKPFRVLKLRSMPTSWQDNLGKHELDQANLPRISKLIRSLHVDEIPQVFNVMLGQMSFVGPRPMIEQVLELLPPDVRTVRQQVRPGITGPWQISTQGARPLHECPELDLAYVSGATAQADAYLLMVTVKSHFFTVRLAPNDVARRFVP